MSENMNYQIEVDKIKNSYITKSNTIQHNPGSFIKLLPYVTTKGKQMVDFSGVIGAFSRIICEKELKADVNTEELVDNIVDMIADFDKHESLESFKDIINSMFITLDGNLVNFSLKTINYINSSNDDVKFAEFLYSTLFDKELKLQVKKNYNKEEINILSNLIFKALPELKDKDYKDDKYECYLPFIKELFTKDFKFLLENEELYKNNLQRFLEYYFMFYVSQLCIKLNQFEKADVTIPETLYYTLAWESTSKKRTGYKFGFDLLTNKVSNIFSHAVILDFFNCNNSEDIFTYKKMFNIFEEMTEEEIDNSRINELYDFYINIITDVRWEDAYLSHRDSGNKVFNILLDLFYAVDYQFNNTARHDPYKNYKDKFINFVTKSFGKRRGSLGYTLNLNEEDIILLTKICINNNERLKLSSLFYEFKRRGIAFDKDSQNRIVQLYEKLNLLEKKSDSGDAQYVRSIL